MAKKSREPIFVIIKRRDHIDTIGYAETKLERIYTCQFTIDKTYRFCADVVFLIGVASESPLVLVQDNVDQKINNFDWMDCIRYPDIVKSRFADRVVNYLKRITILKNKAMNDPLESSDCSPEIMEFYETSEVSMENDN